jgi:hypothetical protein
MNCYGDNSRQLNLYCLADDANSDVAMSPTLCPVPSASSASRLAPMRERLTSGASGPAVELRGNDVYSIEPRDDGLVIRCIAGNLWVSQEGMSDDVVLAAGQSFAPHARGKIVVQPVPAEIDQHSAGVIVIIPMEP